MAPPLSIDTSSTTTNCAPQHTASIALARPLRRVVTMGRVTALVAEPGVGVGGGRDGKGDGRRCTLACRERGVAPREIGGNVAGRHRADREAMLAEFPGGVRRDGVQGGFGGPVGEGDGPTQESCEPRDPRRLETFTIRGDSAARSTGRNAEVTATTPNTSVA
jgi:hypothetical protein